MNDESTKSETHPGQPTTPGVPTTTPHGPPRTPDTPEPATPGAPGTPSPPPPPGAPGTPAEPTPPGHTPEPGPPSGTGAPPSQQEIAVRSALETVMDPEINLSVIDLGLIREIVFQTPPRTLIRMMLTTPFCPYAPQMIADVKQAVTSVVPQECEVEILPDAWSPDLMPDPGLLGFSY